MDLNVKDLVSKMGPAKDEDDEEMDIASEGLSVAAEEIMEAFSAHDSEALMESLRNFIRMARR